MDKEGSDLPPSKIDSDHFFWHGLKERGRHFAKSHHLNRWCNLVISLGVIILVVLFLLYLLFLQPPPDFPIKEFIKVEKGLTIEQAAETLAGTGVIKSPLAMKLWYKLGLAGESNPLVAGDYFFEHRLPLWSVIDRLATGHLGLEYVRITIPEGLTLVQIGKLLEGKLSEFNRARFTLITKGLEGYLFPDTYFFAPNATEDEVVEEMRENFELKIKDLKPDMAISGRTLEEIITMASIIEKEAITPESRRIISGILWKRIDTGMKLQVDAVFPYFLGKNTFELTREDLWFDSPYNTYRYEGLPPAPIANPSFDSIESSLYPEETSYWFYLSDMRSQMHYARTHDEHIKFKNQYLR